MKDDSELQLQLDEIADEFLTRRRSGENPTIEEYQQRHPDLAEQIERSLRTILFVDNLNETESTGSGTSKKVIPEIGDYQIVQKIGQGGMGIVYEANQESLGRRVALKILPQHFADDEKFVERFKREARSAAKLHHTNIVPVFEVGQSNGTLYYAMQFIDGLPLDEVQQEVARIEQDGSTSSHSSVSKLISGSDSSSSGSTFNRQKNYFKSVARLVASVADALDYAHKRSIVHRDVKPSNLILDTEGVVWLTDFGLAKTTDSQITETGDFLGTARYMSPERFKGEGDHRVDIYGLGVTLYEMITLRRPYDAANRIQLIEQIGTTEPRRPSEINRNIPLDLETIILRSMEKDPRRRYQTAGQLAADLLRFADDQPIHARRASLLERSIRWMQRNKAMTAALISMAATIIVLIASSIMILNQRDIARQQKQRADTNAERAGVEARSAREAVQSLLTEVGDEKLRNIPLMDELRRQLLEDALKLNQQFLERSNSQEDREEVVKAYGNVAEVYGKLGRIEDAVKNYELAKQNLGEPSNNDKYVVDWSSVELNKLGFLIGLNRLQEVQSSVRDVIDQLVPIAEKDITRFEPVNNLIVAYRIAGRSESMLGNLGQAEKDLNAAIDLIERLPNDLIESQQVKNANATVRLLLGDVLSLTGKIEQGIIQFELGKKIHAELAKQYPNERIYKEGLANNCSYLAAFYIRSGRYTEAVAIFEEGISQAELLARKFPQVMGYRQIHANSLSGLATAMALSGDSNGALDNFIASADQFESLMEDFPGLPNVRHLASQAIRRVGVHKKNMGYPDESLQPYTRSYEILESLVEEFPDRLAYVIDFAEIAYVIATLPATKENDVARGLEYSKKAVELAEQVIVHNDKDVRTRHKLGKYYANLAEFHVRNNQLEPVESLFQKAIEQQGILVQQAPQFVEHHRLLAVSYFKQAEFLLDQQRFNESHTAVDKAISIRKANGNKNPERFDHPIELVAALQLKGNILAKQGKVGESAAIYLQVDEICYRCFDKFPDVREFREKAVIAYESLLQLPSLPSATRRDDIIEKARKLVDEENNRDEPNENILNAWKRISDL